MLEALDPFSPAGLGPDCTPLEDMETLSQINPLACAGAGGAACHAAAVCVSARCESDGAGVSDARDARASSTTPLLRPVVAPQAQNFGAGAAVNSLTTNPSSTIEGAGNDTPAASILKGSSKVEAAAFFDKSASRGRAWRSAVPVLPSVSPSALPSVSTPVLPSAGVTPSDAVAPAVPFVSTPVLPSAGVTSFDAITPALPSVSRPILPTAASTNDLPIPLPTGAAAASTNNSPILQPMEAAAASTNNFTSETRLLVDRPVTPGIKLIAAACRATCG